jgi:hypothetical protein
MYLKYTPKGYKQEKYNNGRKKAVAITSEIIQNIQNATRAKKGVFRNATRKHVVDEPAVLGPDLHTHPLDFESYNRKPERRHRGSLLFVLFFSFV